MAYKVMQKDENGVLREVVVRGQTVYGSEFDPNEVELKEFDDNTRSFLAIGSTGNPDRIEDVVDQKGWILDSFLKNPIGMWAHDYRSLPVFQVTDLEIKPKSKKMYFKPKFDDYEFADNVYKSYKKGFMKGFSVGFIPLEYELLDREEMTEEQQRRARWCGGRHFKKQELLEISAVPIPMNPEALAGAKSLGLPIEWDIGTDTYHLGPDKAVLNDGSNWIPIDDIRSFKDISTIALDNVKVVSGKPIDGNMDGGKISIAIGYIFPKEFTEEQMIEWFVSKNISEDKASEFVEEKPKNYFELTVGEKGFDLAMKGICGSSSLPTNDKSSWDGDAAQNRMWEKGVATYKKGHVWQKEDGDPENKGTYSLPFADIIDGKLTAVWGGVKAAMAAVHGARNKPQGDRKAMHNFLAKYYKKFDQEVPPFKDYSEEEWENTFGENDHVEGDIDNPLVIPESIEVSDEELVIRTNCGICRIGKDILEKSGLEIREDQLVTVSNRQTLESAAEALSNLLKNIKLESGEPEPEPQAQQVSKPEPEPQAQQNDDNEDLTLLLSVAEELKKEQDEEIELDEETLKEVLGEVLRDNLGSLVRSSVSTNLRHMTGDLE